MADDLKQLLPAAEVPHGHGTIGRGGHYSMLVRLDCAHRCVVALDKGMGDTRGGSEDYVDGRDDEVWRLARQNESDPLQVFLEQKLTYYVRAQSASKRRIAQRTPNIPDSKSFV